MAWLADRNDVSVLKSWLGWPRNDVSILERPLEVLHQHAHAHHPHFFVRVQEVVRLLSQAIVNALDPGCKRERHRA
eukprot:365499-Chlamydomonas_euryale.AAC.3